MNNYIEHGAYIIQAIFLIPEAEEFVLSPIGPQPRLLGITSAVEVGRPAF